MHHGVKSQSRRQLLAQLAALATYGYGRRLRATVMPSAAPAAAAGTIQLGELTVNRLGFGAMHISGPGTWGEPADPEQAHALLRRALALGVNFIDTADCYGPYTSEQHIYEALHPYPSGLVIATKGGVTHSGPGQWGFNGTPQHLREACEGSLKRLHLERIDLYQLHRPDPNVPIAESLGELKRLQHEGKIRHIGVSNFNLEQLQQARHVVHVVSVQNRYNVGDRESDAVLRYCARAGIAFLPWSPLGDRQRIAQLAQQRGISEAQAALAWLLARSPVILPIPGTTSVAHLEENVGAAQVHLTPAELSQIGGLS